MQTMYTIKSLNELADFFDLLASDQISAKRWQRTAKAKAACENKAAAYHDVAETIRNTRLVTGDDQ